MELQQFLVSIYDSITKAEIQALHHGYGLYAELAESGMLPENASLPVYHATNVSVNLDAGLEPRETDEGTNVFITEGDGDSGSGISFDVELLDLVTRNDLENVELEKREEPRTKAPLKNGNKYRVTLSFPEFESKLDHERTDPDESGNGNDDHEDGRSPESNGDDEDDEATAEPDHATENPSAESDDGRTPEESEETEETEERR
jgi:hypothetical protein